MQRVRTSSGLGAPACTCAHSLAARRLERPESPEPHGALFPAGLWPNSKQSLRLAFSLTWGKVTDWKAPQAGQPDKILTKEKANRPTVVSSCVLEHAPFTDYVSLRC
jgi:hypothetical protein